MIKITFKDIFIILVSITLSVLLYNKGISIAKETALVIFTVLLTLVAFFLTIASLVVNFWNNNIVKKLKESGYYKELLSTLKVTSYSFIFTGAYALLYVIFLSIINSLILSAVLLFLTLISIGYLAFNIRRIFLVLNYLNN